MNWLFNRRVPGVLVYRSMERLDLFHVIPGWRSARTGDLWYVDLSDNTIKRVQDGSSVTFFASHWATAVKFE